MAHPKRFLALTIALFAAVITTVTPASAHPDRLYWVDTFEKRFGDYQTLDSYPCEAMEYPFPRWPINMINSEGCDRHVWLHEYADSSTPNAKWACIPPGRIVIGISDDDWRAHPGNFEVGGKGSCNR
ncbi:hypothetical protein [Streptomyces sp. UNOC14_S4]|uniref:hypothetical protein n=1 Tax=Streptomyces sp. UNOC14_S4 TaxID=2872340 RepID=UPI001E40C9D0|nr:hypothetical protein [Streptomyces sp. UNOC14_S4]MCC3768741.1 hypothetical protein [Streptomyces sp. UNOC14_S4]